ncbi:uncharacterized protein FIBRA_03317 [Fibroporia radiculosa]|uniref:Cytochrome P450 n=1 Tax=Fibroporia radiculosa TaxID=599839 RepID=J4G505_9APHY|nr:uncharacterized protein FIBRA_03317 [Fibroporia radiculosa]CCM01268.1 predicted protein [Fibroporia radiculosa]
MTGYGALLVLCLAAVALYRILRHRSQLPLPPGPPGLPYIGNALQMPADQSWKAFTQWAQVYGDVMHLSVMGRDFVVLSSPEAVSDLLEKRSAIYSDRPVMPMLGEMMGYNQLIPLSPYGAHHRDCRKLLVSGLSPRNEPEYNMVQAAKTLEYLPKILADSKRFRSHIRCLVASTVFQITHGYGVANLDDPMTQLAEQTNDDFSRAATPGAFLVDAFPILQYVPDWFPGAGFKRKAKEWRKSSDKLRNEPYEMVEQQVIEGTASPSFTADLIRSKEGITPEDQYIQKCASASFYVAGADTTVSAMESFFLAMSLYPEVQKKAQEEIDSLVEPGRLPNFSDRSKLPYLDALLKEIHRWNPVAPLALPHRVTENDIYRGYRIPAGATILANSWAILHDPARYPSPFDVIPERYLSKTNEHLNPDPRPFEFGYGRRVCPGQLFAEDSLFIFAAMVLSTFNISKASNPDGKTIEPEVEYTGVIRWATVSMVNFVSTIVSLSIVLILTWIKTYAIRKHISSMGQSGKSLSNLCARDGSIYFVILLIMTIFNLVATTYQAIGDVTVLELAVSPILISRFLLDLRGADTARRNHVDTDEALASTVSEDTPESLCFSSAVVGNLEAPLTSFFADDEDQQEHEELPCDLTDSPSGGLAENSIKHEDTVHLDVDYTCEA